MLVHYHQNRARGNRSGVAHSVKVSDLLRAHSYAAHHTCVLVQIFMLESYCGASVFLGKDSLESPIYIHSDLTHHTHATVCTSHCKKECFMHIISYHTASAREGKLGHERFLYR